MPDAPADIPTTEPTPEPTAAPPPARRSVWTPKQKLIRVVWTVIARPFWIFFPGLRAPLLRLFGGTAGPRCRFGRNVEITIPWHIRCGSDVTVGDRVILYSLGVITLEDGVSIDYRAHICAGTHDMTDSTFPLLRPPITIGAGSFVGLDAYIGPGVRLGRDCRVWPRTSVYKSAPANTHLAGSPGRPVDAEETAALAQRSQESHG